MQQGSEVDADAHIRYLVKTCILVKKCEGFVLIYLPDAPLLPWHVSIKDP